MTLLALEWIRTSPPFLIAEDPVRIADCLQALQRPSPEFLRASTCINRSIHLELLRRFGVVRVLVWVEGLSARERPHAVQNVQKSLEESKHAQVATGTKQLNKAILKGAGQGLLVEGPAYLRFRGLAKTCKDHQITGCLDGLAMATLAV